MMKNFRILFSTLMLTALMGCNSTSIEPEKPVGPPQPGQPAEPPRPELEKIKAWLETIPGVSKVEEINQTAYKKYFVFLFEQLIDPKNPNTGTFSQRVFLAHQNFDHPMVFNAQGYDSRESMESPGNEELIDRYEANWLEVEHRYSGESVPLGCDWQYLTCENAAADMHAVREALGVAYTGKWIAMGASKNGGNAMSYTMYYPKDMAATVAYVAPICNGLNDPRFAEHLQSVGTPEMRKKIEDFQVMLLERRQELKEQLVSESESTVAKEKMTLDQEYESLVLVVAQAHWQYGLSADKIPEAEDQTTNEEIITYLGTRFENPKNSSAQGFSKANDKPDFDNHHYNVQTLKELGDGAYNITPRLYALMPNHESWTKNTLARFIVPANAADIQYSDKFYKAITQWLKEQDPHLICIYGEYDYWTAGAPDKAFFNNKSNMAIFVVPEEAHNACIELLGPADKQEVWAKLDSWIKQ